jgi:hypothetical protein
VIIEFPVSSYYYAKKREAEPAARETRDAMLKEKVMEVRKGVESQEVYGVREMWLEMDRQGVDGGALAQWSG